MERPLSGREWAQAIEGEIDTFTDADTGVTDEQEGVTGDIVTAQEFLLDEAILFGSQGTGKPGIGLRHVIGMEKTNQGGQIVEPSQFLHQTAQRDDMQGASAFDQRRLLRGEPCQPAQNVRVPPQLFEGSDARMMLAQNSGESIRWWFDSGLWRSRSSKWSPTQWRRRTPRPRDEEREADAGFMSGTAERAAPVEPRRGRIADKHPAE